eukprot:TRINITY_DN21557_c0_g1_i1.p1 TRINITY_DN21557_c0_g1~~TRINITY_DN21557_c0_g1_i1.p1  ORF type:complete len:898 (-),score=162.37 TRINITY_DN21557_c0_g1_i1:141-2834(-)
MAASPKERKFRQADNAVCLGDGRTIHPPLIGGVLAHDSPTIVASASRLFAPCGNSAIGFNAKTGRRMGALGPHRGRVTAVSAGPSRTDCADPIVTGTSLGEVRIWDSRGLNCLCTLEFGSPVKSLCWKRPETILVVLGVAGAAASVEKIEVPSLETCKRAGSLPLSAKRSGAFDALDGFAVLTDGQDLCVWAEGWETCRRYPHSQTLTAVSIDPFKRYVSVGDTKGVVWTWWGILEGSSSIDKVPRAPARWRWHATAVLSLAHSGPVMLSGGSEGVLCVRNMEDESILFIPRFPAALRHIAVSAGNRLICCSLEDNSLAILDDCQGWVRPRYIQAVDTPVRASEPSSAGSSAKKQQKKLQQLARAVLHPLAGGGVAMTASGRRAQFFDGVGHPLPGKPTSLERGGSVNSDPMQRWALQQLAFSAHATCLMTCESRISPALERFDSESAHSCVVKWWRKSEGGQYILDSISNNPHSAEVRVALAHPHQENFFATTSADGVFKLWDRLPVGGGADDKKQDQSSQSKCWQCVATGSWRSQPILSSCFSADGSALATGVPGFVVLWEAQSGTEVQTLPLSEAGDRPEQLASVVACDRFLLLASVRSQQAKEEVLCWDLAALQVVARLDLSTALQGTGCCGMRCLPPHSGSSGPLRLLAFRQSEAEIMVWRLSSGKKPSDSPSFTEEASIRLPHCHGVLDASFIGKGDDAKGCHLFCWTSLLELWDINLTSTASEAQQAQADLEESATPSKGTLSAIVGGRETAPGGGAAAGTGPAKLLKMPLRTTSAQQAGLVPRLVQRVVPPHVPSHMLPPPSVIWAGMVSVFAKPLDGSLQAGPGMTSLPSQSTEASAALQSAGLEAAEMSSLPPWVQQSVVGQPAPEQELVDANWMDQLVKGALSKSK